jgi:hypothetical protein
MTIYIRFHSASMEAAYHNVKDVYTKDSLLCLSFADEIIKFPLCNIFSIRSNYKRSDNE